MQSWSSSCSNKPILHFVLQILSVQNQGQIQDYIFWCNSKTTVVHARPKPHMQDQDRTGVGLVLHLLITMLYTDQYSRDFVIKTNYGEKMNFLGECFFFVVLMWILNKITILRGQSFWIFKTFFTLSCLVNISLKQNTY